MRVSDHRRARPRTLLGRLVGAPPSRLRDRRLDADRLALAELPRPAGTAALVRPPEDAPDLACWTRVGERPIPADETADASERAAPTAVLVSEPPIPGAAEDTVVHTLVLRAAAPVASVGVEYGPLDAAVAPAPRLRTTTGAGRSVDVRHADVGPDGALTVTFATPPADDVLFLEYEVTRNPSGDRHVVEVRVNDDGRTVAGLTLLG